jgi:hypothetical protein
VFNSWGRLPNHLGRTMRWQGHRVHRSEHMYSDGDTSVNHSAKFPGIVDDVFSSGGYPWKPPYSPSHAGTQQQFERLFARRRDITTIPLRHVAQMSLYAPACDRSLFRGTSFTCTFSVVLRPSPSSLVPTPLPIPSSSVLYYNMLAFPFVQGPSQLFTALGNHFPTVVWCFVVTQNCHRPRLRQLFETLWPDGSHMMGAGSRRVDSILPGLDIRPIIQK